MFGNNKINLRRASPLLAHLLCLIDIALVVLLVPFLVVVLDVQRGDHYQAVMIIGGAGSLIFFHGVGLYQPRRGQFLFIELLTIIKAWAMVVGVVLMALFAFKVGHFYSRAVLLTWFCLTPMVLYSLHVLFRKVLHIIRSKGKNQRTAVIVGAGDLGIALAEYLGLMTWAGIRVLGFFDDQKTLPEHKPGAHEILGAVDHLLVYLKQNDVDLVYIALPMSDEKIIKEILQQCRTQGAQIYLVPDLYAFHLYNASVETLGDILLLNFNPDPRSKRVFDVTFSLLVLLISLPLWVIVALLIKLQDGGSVLYRHRRISVAGKSFKCLKFRTMCRDADARLADVLENDSLARREWETTFKLKSDPRVTSLGRLLRRTIVE